MRVRHFLLFGIIMLAWVVSTQAGSLMQTLDAFGIQQPKVHKSAPDFTLAMLGGGEKALADYRGKVVLLHFWATWCVPCRHEMPQIERLWRRYRDDGLVVLGVNVDRGNLQAVRQFVQQRNLSFPVVIDPEGEVRNRYEVRGLPTTYLIDRDGKIIGRIIGERKWNGRQATAIFKQLLAR
ncbi:MAG: TlpA disulfide reductase family protein [Mariprofundaceae bacterium]|nr:TlpA disulfide reductase family protein [Mariprofundaceae bacterium]